MQDKNFFDKEKASRMNALATALGLNVFLFTTIDAIRTAKSLADPVFIRYPERVGVCLA